MDRIGDNGMLKGRTGPIAALLASVRVIALLRSRPMVTLCCANAEAAVGA